MKKKQVMSYDVCFHCRCIRTPGYRESDMASILIWSIPGEDNIWGGRFDKMGCGQAGVEVPIVRDMNSKFELPASCSFKMEHEVLLKVYSNAESVRAAWKKRKAVEQKRRMKKGMVALS